jgi:hypothetical protein
LLFSSLITSPIGYSSHYFSHLATLMSFHSSFTLPLFFLFSLASLEILTSSTFVLFFSTFGLLFNPEVRGSMLFQNVGTFLLDYTV